MAYSIVGLSLFGYRIANIFADFIEGNHESKEFIIKNLKDINITEGYGSNLLHYACSNNDYKIAKLLIKHGININTRNMDGDTPLDYAIKKGNYKIANLLIKYGAVVGIDEINNFNVLHNIIFEKKDYKMFRLAIKNGINLIIKDPLQFYNSPLSHRSTLRSLDLNLLDYSATEQDYEAAKFLIKEGIELHIKNKDTCTFLTYNSLVNKDYKILKYLIKNNGLDTNLKIGDFTIFEYAIINEDKKLIKLLLKDKAKKFEYQISNFKKLNKKFKNKKKNIENIKKRYLKSSKISFNWLREKLMIKQNKQLEIENTNLESIQKELKEQEDILLNTIIQNY